MISVGQTIGNYTITAKLGEGGMGIVYLAEHPVIGRKVALKAIHPELSRNPEVVSRFMTEAKSVNQIGNEHIVDIHDFGNTSTGEFYFIMEFLQGESLAERLQRERLFVPSRALQIGAQVADALAASHGHGIIHRDLKPENIFLIPRGSTIDFVKVLDFGLAKLTQGEEKVTHKTRTGSVMGTPYYMAPEQCEGRTALDQRADLYSLGVILYEMMTGRVPFGGDGYGEIIVKHMTMPPPSPRGLNPSLTPAHEAILLRALAKRREDRFGSMQDLRTAMLNPEAYLAHAPPLPRNSSSPATQEPVRGDASSQVVIGDLPGSTHLGSEHASMPSTFRHGAGELLEEDTIVPRTSRKGLVVTLVVAAAVAAVGAFVVVTSKAHRQVAVAPPATVAPPTAAPSPPPPPVLDRTVIKFDSRPPGAVVVRKDSNTLIGTTPFEHAVPYGKTAIEFSFRKPGFEEAALSLIPESPNAALSVSLVAERPAPAEAEPPRPAASKPPRSRPPSARPKHAPRPVNDEDGVLEPSFR
jgi:eukaryotic-like serine/threonine-protein kinase